MFENESEGSLLSCLKSQNYASGLVGYNEKNINTAFKCFSFEITLTEDGILHYKEVIALFFEFKRKIEEDWLTES